ncbi:MAG: tRNA (adenosine(37)-N6)-threonylcarbamoyltransferase complex ATPase subunit type 1 TsaE [Planctomycetota bacterium]|nr:tRNA (adenosine(37)-N6)-threonylcarbamoyltransferase complex ATPase subunit type 1 TsaE [Planctomycetota bacterium]
MSIQLVSSNLELHVAEISIDDLVDCQAFAEQLSSMVRTPLTIALSGTLGAGKTQWTRYFAMALGAPGRTISSPTFMLVHQYASQPPIFHLDAYRIGDEEEMLELGIEEMMDSEAVTIIEWADRFPALLPRNTLHLHFEVASDQAARKIKLEASGQRAQTILREWIAIGS